MINCDGSVTDTNSVSNQNGAPNYGQTRNQVFTPDGGQAVTITDLDGGGNVQDRTVNTVSASGLVRTSAIQTTGSGTTNLNETDVTVLNADGSTTETVKEVAAGGARVLQRVITTSADGRNVTTKVDNDGNGVFEQSDVHVTAADGSQTDTVTDYNNATGQAVAITAIDGSTSPTAVETISADGLVKTVTEGGVTATTVLFADANGSYQWKETSATKGTIASAAHFVDTANIDSWSYTGSNGQTQTVRLDLGSEQRDLGVAEGIYRAVLGRSMQDGDTQALVKYIQGGVLNQTQLTNDLLASAEFTQKYGTASSASLARVYQNLFGHAPPSSELGTYLGQIASGAMTLATAIDAIAQKAEDEAAGNGLLQIMANASTAAPIAVSLIPTSDQAFLTTGSAYETFVSSFPPPNGNLTQSQINAFLNLVYPSQSGVTTQQGSSFLTATSSQDGSTDELLYGSNQTIDAAASKVKQIIDVGSGNTLKATSGVGITLSGGASDVLIGGSGSSTLLGLGNAETISTGSGTTSVEAAGNNTTVNASLGTSNIAVTGSNDTITNATSSTSIDVSGTGAQLSGTGATITLEASATNAEIAGSGQTITAAGGGQAITLNAAGSRLTTDGQATIAVNGNSDAVNADTGSVLSIAGIGGTIATTNSRISLAAGASSTVTGNGDTVTQLGNSTLTLSGQAASVEVQGKNAIDTLSSGSLMVDAGNSATLNGVNNAITLGAGSAFIDNGTNDAINAMGANDALTLAGAGGTATMSSGSATVTAAVTATGNNDAFALSGGGQLALNGSNDTATFADSTSQVSVTVGQQSVAQSSNGTLTLTGFTDPSAVTVANGHATISFGNGDTAVTHGVPGEIDGFDTSGHQRWAQLYNTLSGALNETDQYKYNASIKLTEVDKSNGAGTLTEADLYSPTRNIEVGSYMYSPSGTVNEVVDLVGNHDWMRGTNGVYTDKTTGATSNTQPVLNAS